MANSVFQKIIQGGAKVAEEAAPIVGAALGGPAGYAAGKKVAQGVSDIASNRHLGGSGQKQGKPGFVVPSSASSIDEARSQDKTRMQNQYGLGSNGG